MPVVLVNHGEKSNIQVGQGLFFAGRRDSEGVRIGVWIARVLQTARLIASLVKRIEAYALATSRTALSPFLPFRHVRLVHTCSSCRIGFPRFFPAQSHQLSKRHATMLIYGMLQGVRRTTTLGGRLHLDVVANRTLASGMGKGENRRRQG